MRPYGRGILPESQIYLFDVSEAAKRMYFYALCVGHYQCSADYVVNRPSFDSYLLMYVRQGRCYYLRDGQRVELPADAFALIDCHIHHEYGAVEPSELYWIHFDGPTAREVCGVIAAGGNPVPRNPERCRRELIELCDRTARSGPMEAPIVNREIVNLLTEFLLDSEERAAGESSVIDEIRNYILDNPDKHLTLEELARRANLSPYHFARTFKRQVGLSPHDYLIQARLNLAKFYLLGSNDAIKEIAYSCGFSSEASFCTTFKSRMGMTPTGFRMRRSSMK